MKSNNIAPLTSLRFVFALFVFLSHLGFLTQESNSFLAALYRNVFYEGYIGVGFFFMLSGFVLALNYKEKIIERKVTYRSFIVARISRIYPMHILMLLVAIPMTFSPAVPITVVWFVKLPLNLFLVQGFVPFIEFYCSFNIVSWSLSNELFFYALFPLLILLLKKLSQKTSFVFLIGMMLINISLFFFLPSHYHHAYLYVNPFVRVVDFAIGIGLYEIYSRIQKTDLKFNFHLWETISVLVFISLFTFHHLVPEGLRYAVYYWPAMILILLVFAFQGGYLSRVLTNKVMIFLGEISFSFYMVHWLAIRYFDVMHKRFVGGEKGMMFVVVLFVFSLCASIISYKLIEQPVGKWVKRKFA